MASGSTRSATPGSPIGRQQYHLSVSYLRSKRGQPGYRQPTAQQLRAGRALGHPRPGGGDPVSPAVSVPGMPPEEC